MILCNLIKLNDHTFDIRQEQASQKVHWYTPALLILLTIHFSIQDPKFELFD